MLRNNLVCPLQWGGSYVDFWELQGKTVPRVRAIPNPKSTFFILNPLLHHTCKWPLEKRHFFSHLFWKVVGERSDRQISACNFPLAALLLHSQSHPTQLQSEIGGEARLLRPRHPYLIFPPHFPSSPLPSWSPPSISSLCPPAASSTVARCLPACLHRIIEC